MNTSIAMKVDSAKNDILASVCDLCEVKASRKVIFALMLRTGMWCKSITKKTPVLAPN